MPEETGQERASSERIQDTPAPSQNVLYLGIDLGTANSSVATSTDVTRTVPSVVGWPKDLIAYKFLQKPIEMFAFPLQLPKRGLMRVQGRRFGRLKVTVMKIE